MLLKTVTRSNYNYLNSPVLPYNKTWILNSKINYVRNEKGFCKRYSKMYFFETYKVQNRMYSLEASKNLTAFVTKLTTQSPEKNGASLLTGASRGTAWFGCCRTLVGPVFNLSPSSGGAFS